MKTSTIWAKKQDTQKKKHLRLLAVAFWVIVWQVAAMALKQEILLASPVSVSIRLWNLLFQPDFWGAVGFSCLRIVSGFLSACIAASLLAALSSRFSGVHDLLAPLISVIQSTPVASFIILVLIWIPSKNLSVLISFLMVTPVVYTNLLQGIRSMDHELLEMAFVFRIPFFRRLRYVYIPQVMPYFRSACAVSLGLAWKSGIAAEVIGLPQGSIGERLYEAKIYLETPDLFAWTVVVILVSLSFEKLCLWGLSAVSRRLERG